MTNKILLDLESKQKLVNLEWSETCYKCPLFNHEWGICFAVKDVIETLYESHFSDGKVTTCPLGIGV